MASGGPSEGGTEVNQEPRRVLFILELPTPQRTPVLDELAGSDLVIEVWYLRDAGSDRIWGPLQLGHQARVVGPSRAEIWRLLRMWCGPSRPDTVAIFGYRGWLRAAAFLLARITRTRVVVRFDSNILDVQLDWRPKAALRRSVIRALVPRSARVWAIGQRNEEYWKDYVGRRNVARIPYTVPRPPRAGAEVARTSDPLRMRFLFVGRLSPEKDIRTLISAFSCIEGPAFESWTLTIVGEGPERGHLQSIADSDSRVVLAGAVPYSELGSLYGTHDVLVLPSVRESWGLVVNEALIFGLRVLVSKQCGSAELVTSDAVGATFEPRDVDGLASAMAACRDHLRRIPRPDPSPVQAMYRDLTSDW